MKIKDAKKPCKAGPGEGARGRAAGGAHPWSREMPAETRLAPVRPSERGVGVQVILSAGVGRTRIESDIISFLGMGALFDEPLNRCAGHLRRWLLLLQFWFFNQF